MNAAFPSPELVQLEWLSLGQAVVGGNYTVLNVAAEAATGWMLNDANTADSPTLHLLSSVNFIYFFFSLQCCVNIRKTFGDSQNWASLLALSLISSILGTTAVCYFLTIRPAYLSNSTWFYTSLFHFFVLNCYPFSIFSLRMVTSFPLRILCGFCTAVHQTRRFIWAYETALGLYPGRYDLAFVSLSLVAVAGPTIMFVIRRLAGYDVYSVFNEPTLIMRRNFIAFQILACTTLYPNISKEWTHIAVLGLHVIPTTVSAAVSRNICWPPLDLLSLLFYSLLGLPRSNHRERRRNNGNGGNSGEKKVETSQSNKNKKGKKKAD